MNLRLHLLASILLTLTVLLYLANAVAQDAPVRVVVEGALVQFEPATVRLRVRILPHSDNRGLTIGVISDGYGRSSWEDLPGANAPITRWVLYRDIPAGQYDVMAVVVKVDGSRIQATAAFQVLGHGF